MQHGWLNIRSKPFTLLLGLMAAAFVFLIITYPEQAFSASLSGLRLWWDWVFPALLPFLAITEMLFGYGIVHGIGVLLTPFMRLFFRLPGAGGWALAMGLIGGYPLGADTAAKLRMEGELGREEAERLLSISHLCNPMVIVGVIGTGFLHSPEAGIILALLHYLAAIAAGILLRFIRPATGQQGGPVKVRHSRESLLTQAARKMSEARIQDGRAFGKLLGDSVSRSIQALLLIGGLMMIFSVAIRLVSLRFGQGAASGWIQTWLTGLLEPHLGAYAFSRLTDSSGPVAAALIGMALAWSGLSVHAQVLSFTRGTDIRFGTFLRFRLLHGAMAAGFTLLLWEPLGKLIQGTEAVFSPAAGLRPGPVDANSGYWSLESLAALWKASFTMLALLLALMLLMSMTIRLLERALGPRFQR